MDVALFLAKFLFAVWIVFYVGYWLTAPNARKEAKWARDRFRSLPFGVMKMVFFLVNAQLVFPLLSILVAIFVFLTLILLG